MKYHFEVAGSFVAWGDVVEAPVPVAALDSLVDIYDLIRQGTT